MAGGEKIRGEKILLVIPCFNEEQAIVPLLEEIQRTLSAADYDTLVIDDGSTDRTYERARAKSACISLPTNLGIGGAVQTGIKFAFRHGYAGCVQLDGDGQHAPGEVNALVRCWRESGANLVVGSRYLDFGGFQSSRLRRLGGAVMARVLRLLFPGLRITDPTSGMRLMDRKATALFAAMYPHDYPEPISLAWGARCGLQVREVGVVMRERKHGRSSIAGLQTVGYMVRALSYILLARFQTMAPKP